MNFNGKTVSVAAGTPLSRVAAQAGVKITYVGRMLPLPRLLLYTTTTD